MNIKHAIFSLDMLRHLIQPCEYVLIACASWTKGILEKKKVFSAM